jgi:Tfp pilus assembly protein PilF
MDDDGQVVATVPTIAAAAGTVPPNLESYAKLRDKIKSLTATVKDPQLLTVQTAQAEADLSDALEISPRDGEVLRLGAELYRRSKNDGRLAAILSTLTESAPTESGLFMELGHVLFRMRDWDRADRALLKARELKPGDPAVAEELARIRLTRGDDRGFLAFVDERIALGPATQELWLLRADAANRLGDWQGNAKSVERAIALGSIPLERRTALVRLYLQHQAPDRALLQVRAVADSLPPDAAVRAEYAGFLEELKQPKEAMAAWKRTLEADPKMELAYYRVARLQIDQNALAEALESAEAGIAAAPRSSRLYLVKAEILEKQDRFYQARQTLREAVSTAPDSSLLARLAEMEDAGGEHAARYYRTLAEVGDQTVLQRGLQAAERDGDWENIAWFQGRMGVAHTAADRARTGTVTMPGGLAALAFVAHSRPSSPERFLVEFARTVVLNYQPMEKKVSAAFTAGIREHFLRIAELLEFGKPFGGKVVVTITAKDKNGQKNAEKVLDLLGWKIRTSKQGVKLDPAEKGAKAAHQETATALAIDEIGMQQALEMGKPFTFEIPMDSVNVVLGEEPWRTQFYAKEHYAGGIVEAMCGNLDLAQTYAALGEMDPSAASALVSGLGLKTLEEKYATLLYQYSSSMAVEHGRAEVPGGQPAEAIWAKLAGASPSQPGPFLGALLAKDEGKLLAYYTALGELDIRHQRLFTRNATRAGRFYELFKDSPEIQRSAARHLKSGSFVEFLSEVPIDDDGNVDFPGSPEVWMVVKGQSHSVEHTDKLLKRLKRVVAPDIEDEILLRLARTRYKESSEAHSELDNFVAVVRIDRHRAVPLDETSALLLAQHFAEDGAAYPYFSILTGLGQKEFQQFFALSATLRQMAPAERAAQLASIESLIEIVCLAREAGTIDDTQSAELFGKIVGRFQKVTGPAERTALSLDLVREILSHGKTADADPDSAMQNLLLGPDVPAGVFADGTAPVHSRLWNYRQVLELQKAPSLATLLALSDAARNLANGKGSPAAEIPVLESRGGTVPVVEVPKELGVKGKEKDLLEAFQPRRLQEIVKQLHEKTAKKNVKLQDLEKLSKEYLEAIDSPTRWALAGIVYAYFLTPDDLLVSEDTLLLRKHQFAVLEHVGGMERVFEPSQIIPSSERAGSNFQGTFATFADSAGSAAAMSAKLGGDNGQLTAGKQLSAIRSTNWDQLRDEDLRLFGLKVAVAREWIVRAAAQPDLADTLGEASFGLLSLTRRSELLAALADGNWRSAWSVVTLSDQYFLGDRYLERYPKDPWDSPATRALRRELARNDGSRLSNLGNEFAAIFGCSHPHLRSAMPYEEYEKDIAPFKLAERSAEFKLYLARYADMAGVSASALEAVAERAARAILKHMQMSDVHDWKSVLESYAHFDDKAWAEVLTAQQ